MASMEEAVVTTKPLYLRMKEDLLRRVQRGEWRPGEMLPSENVLAVEYAVSVGTARKAIEELAAEHLLLRQRGRGTTVALHSQRQGGFRYYRLTSKDGRRVNEETVYLGVVSARASAAEARMFGINRGASVTRVRRFRLCRKKPFVLETLSLREDVFPGIGRLIEAARPEYLYALLEREFHIIIAKAEEKVTAVLAGPEDAKILGVRPGDAMLEVERLAFDLNDRPVELRIMRARNDAYYLNKFS
jgi:GntR family transcriptional regulator